MSIAMRFLLVFHLLMFAAHDLWATIYYVTHTGDTGVGSFRQALENSQMNADRDSIYFNIPGAGPHIIQPLSDYPYIWESSVLIDGYTQSGSSPATETTPAVLEIEINGSLNYTYNGLRIDRPDCLIRGLAVTGFQKSFTMCAGVVFYTRTRGSAIEGCYLGTNIAGTSAKGNLWGLHLYGAKGVRVGGDSPAQRNVISGNSNIGIHLEQADSIEIMGNYFGTDAGGTQNLVAGNPIFTNLSSNVIIRNNVIAGSSCGITAASGGAFYIHNYIIQGNKIGTDKTGLVPLGSGSYISLAYVRDFLIGGTNPGDGNIIYSSLTDAIQVAYEFPNGNSYNIAISGNNIRTDNKLGIDLQESIPTVHQPNLNDLNDVDEGPNHLQNYPVIATVLTDSVQTLIKGFLNSRPNSGYSIELFRNAAANDVGFGPGELYVGRTDVATDAMGNTSFVSVLPCTVSVGNTVCCTATDVDGNTSEFSANYTIQSSSFVDSLPDNPLMDIRMRRIANICLGDSSLLDLAFDVRTQDGSARAINQIQDAVVFDAAFANSVLYVRALSWTLPSADYENLYQWTALERVLEFRSTHLEGHGYTGLGGPTLTDWHTVAVFRIVYTAQAGQYGDIGWHDGTPHYNVSALKSPAPGVETIQNAELDKIEDLPLTCAADLALSQPHTNYSVYQTETTVLTYFFQNLGGSDSRDIAVSDSLPAGEFQFVTFTASNGSYDWDTHTWTLAEMAAGRIDTLRVTVRAMTPGHYDVAVKRTNSQPEDPLSSNDRVVTSLEILPGADVGIAITARSSPVWQGKLDTLYFRVVNNGPRTLAEDIVVQTDLTAGFKYVSHYDRLAGGENSDSYNVQTGEWTIGTLSTAVEESLRIIVRADSAGVQICRGYISNSRPFDHISGNDSTETEIAVTASARFFVRLYLEGPFRLSRTDTVGIDTTYMACKLRYNPRDENHSMLPVVSPYGDHRSSGVVEADSLPADIVDWLYVQVRPSGGNGYGAELMLDNGYTGQSCFLRKDGALVNVDGEEGLLLPALPVGSYYMVVNHRNHLRVMTSTAVNTAELTGYNWGEPVKGYYDFTESKGKYFTKADDDQRGCHLQPIDGKWLVAAGDGDEGRQVENQDWDLWFTADGLAIGYFQTDYDLGGQVEGRDETLWYDNLFVRSPFSWDMNQP